MNVNVVGLRSNIYKMCRRTRHSVWKSQGGESEGTPGCLSCDYRELMSAELAILRRSAGISSSIRTSRFIFCKQNIKLVIQATIL